MPWLTKLAINHPKTILFCLGCLSALAMAPVYIWPLMVLGYSSLLFYIANEAAPRRVFLYCWLFFFGYYLTSFYWISNALFVDLNIWWWALPFSFAGLPFAFALIPALCTAIASFAPAALRVIAFIAALIIADYLRGNILTGFPWNMPVHAWAETPFVMNILPHTGFYILNGLTIIMVCFLYFTRHRFVRLGVIALMILLFAFPGHYKETQTTDVPDNIVMVQANISQKEKWDPDYILQNMMRYIEMTNVAITTAEPQIIIWPETAISQNFLTYPGPRAIFNQFLSSLPDESVLITGYLNSDEDGYYNSLALFDRLGNILSKYDKHHLVPFGEYMPLGLDTITGFAGFVSGDRPNPISIGETSLLPLICYEIIFPRYAKNNDEHTYILNITNDAWFGHTAGPYQHFDQARFRAVENNKYVIRLSGNGMSGIISQKGKILIKTPLNKTSLINTNK